MEASMEQNDRLFMGSGLAWSGLVWSGLAWPGPAYLPACSLVWSGTDWTSGPKRRRA